MMGTFFAPPMYCYCLMHDTVASTFLPVQQLLCRMIQYCNKDESRTRQNEKSLKKRTNHCTVSRTIRAAYSTVAARRQQYLLTRISSEHCVLVWSLQCPPMELALRNLWRYKASSTWPAGGSGANRERRIDTHHKCETLVSFLILGIIIKKKWKCAKRQAFKFGINNHQSGMPTPP